MIDEFRIAQHRSQRLSEIATENDPAQRTLRRQVNLDECRAEDVTRITEPATRAASGLEALLVIDRPQARKAQPGLLHRVERGDVPAAPRVAGAIVAVGPLRLLFLDMGRIQQHHPEQIHGCPGRVDRPLVAERNQPRQQAGMVEMSVCQQDEIDLFHVQIQRTHIAHRSVPPTLEKPAIDEKAAALVPDQGT